MSLDGQGVTLQKKGKVVKNRSNAVFSGALLFFKKKFFLCVAAALESRVKNTDLKNVINLVL